MTKNLKEAMLAEYCPNALKKASTKEQLNALLAEIGKSMKFGGSFATFKVGGIIGPEGPKLTANYNIIVKNLQEGGFQTEIVDYTKSGGSIWIDVKW